VITIRVTAVENFIFCASSVAI